jgi:hypothetical protein
MPRDGALRKGRDAVSKRRSEQTWGNRSTRQERHNAPYGVETLRAIMRRAYAPLNERFRLNRWPTAHGSSARKRVEMARGIIRLARTVERLLWGMPAFGRFWPVVRIRNGGRLLPFASEAAQLQGLLSAALSNRGSRPKAEVESDLKSGRSTVLGTHTGRSASGLAEASLSEKLGLSTMPPAGTRLPLWRPSLFPMM